MPRRREGIDAEAEARRVAETEQQARAADRQSTPVPSANDPHLSQMALLAGLAVAAKDLSENAKQLYRASVLSRVERVMLLAILIINLLTSGIVGYGVLRLNGLAETNRNYGQTIVDCTQPGGQCFKRGQEQTAAAVAQLSLVSIAAVECADRYDGEALHRCITARLETGR